MTLILTFMISCYADSHNQQETQVCFSSGCIQAEIVSEGEALARGLQNREHLADKSGMLFIFPDNALHRFWMKNTLIPLDMIWMDEEKTVVFIQENVPPCRRDPCAIYGPPRESRYVLETNAGTAAALGVAIGAKAEFKLLSGGDKPTVLE